MRSSLSRRRIDVEKTMAQLKPLVSRLSNKMLEAAAEGMEEGARAANARNRKMGMKGGQIVSDTPQQRRARIKWLQEYCKTATSREDRRPCAALRGLKEV